MKPRFIKPKAKLSLFAILLASVIGLGFSGELEAEIVYWNPSSFEGAGATDFDAAVQMFAPFQASSMALLSEGTNPDGGPLFHSHGTVTTATLQLHLDGVWNQVWSGVADDLSGKFVFLRDVLAPITFPTATVDGVWWDSSPHNSQTFHSFADLPTYGTDGATSFVFGAVPEPGSLALLGVGLVGLAASRRQRQ